jgi:hypothetical protein
MLDVRQGSCLCGAIRYRVKGDPVRVYACHCTFCQRHTGGAFAVIAWFDEQNFELTGDLPTTYEHRSDESNNLLRISFCIRCGTNFLMETVEKYPRVRAIMCGTLDDPSSIKVDYHVWARSARNWMAFPDDVKVFQTSSGTGIEISRD